MWLIRWGLAVVVFGGGLFSFVSVSAYTGGPELVDVLGWDAETNRLYIRDFPRDESAFFGAVKYFDLRSKEPEMAVPVDWNPRTNKRAYPREYGLLEELRTTLKRLQPLATHAIPKAIRILRADSLVTGRGVPEVLYTLDVTYEIGIRFQVTSFSPHVVVKDVYKIPDQNAFLYVVVFRGTHDIAETQLAIVVDAPFDKVRRIEWR